MNISWKKNITGVVSVSYTHLDVYKRQVQRPDREHFLPERDVGRDKSMLSCNLQRQFKKESVFKGSYHSGKTGGTAGFGRIPGVQ